MIWSFTKRTTQPPYEGSERNSFALSNESANLPKPVHESKYGSQAADRFGLMEGASSRVSPKDVVNIGWMVGNIGCPGAEPTVAVYGADPFV